MNVTVHFIGICTHVNSGPTPRIVLVDASFGLWLADCAIPPHAAMLSIPSEFIGGPVEAPGLTPLAIGGDVSAWKMNGVGLALADVSGPVTYGSSYHCLPQLKATAHREDLPLNDRVFSGAAACQFPIESGELDAYMHGEAIIARLTAAAGPSLQLLVTRMWDNSSSAIPLRSANGIDPYFFVSNAGQGADAVADFLLHYGVTTWTPDSVLTPITNCTPRPASDDEMAMLARLSGAASGTIGLYGHGGMTIGCSNSIYP